MERIKIQKLAKQLQGRRSIGETDRQINRKDRLQTGFSYFFFFFSCWFSTQALALRTGGRQSHALASLCPSNSNRFLIPG